MSWCSSLVSPQKAGDKVRAESHVGYGQADRVNEVEVGLAGVSSSHALEDGGRSRLGRHVQLVANVGPFGHELQEFRGIILGMGRRETDPHRRIERTHRIHQIAKVVSGSAPGTVRVGKGIAARFVPGRPVGQHGLLAPVVVGIHVLSQQDNLLDAVSLNKFGAFLHNRCQRTAPFMTSCEWHNTIQTHVVATPHD